MEALFQAVKGGDEGEVTRLLDGDPTLLERANERGQRSLTVAAMHGQLGVVKLLVQRGASMTATTNLGSTALFVAAEKGQESVVAWLLGQGAHATRRESDGSTPFIMARHQRHLSVARLLLQHTGKQALQETDKGGRRALHYAASCADEQTVAFLLGEGAQANSRDADGNTPLMLAWGRGRLGLDVVKVLLQHTGKQALQETDKEGRRALHYAASSADEETVAFLLGEGAQANSRDADGSTPLMLACEEGRLGVVRLLLQHTGKQALQETNMNGLRALHYAAYGGCEDMVTFLISEGVQANSRDRFGATPLMTACQGGRPGAVRWLVQHSGPQALQETDEAGSTALHFAVKWGREEVVRFLLVAGADPTVTDNEGRTPRAIADVEEEEEEEGEEHVKQGSRAGCVAVFEWYACELERRHVLHRAACLCKAWTMQRDMPTSQVPPYLAARVAAGHALPRVEVVMPQRHEQQEEGAIEELADGGGKRKAGGEGDGPQGADAGEEGHAVLTYVLAALDEHLLTELLEGFPYEK